MIKVSYTEDIKNGKSPYGKVVKRTKYCNTLTEAVQISKYLSNTVILIGKPILEDAQ
jgi:hypothetical protein